jgi:hypothetical protein
MITQQTARPPLEGFVTDPLASWQRLFESSISMITQQTTHSPFENFTIDPMTNWERMYNPQFIINYNGDDVGIENTVLRQAGSYGKQLGKLFDVLDVLIAHLDPQVLKPEEQKALEDFRQLQGVVSRAKEQTRKP